MTSSVSDVQRSALTSKRVTLLALTFIVSFCSFAYEFVYSEELTLIYGGTVSQYAITIGLYFFALGMGAALVDDLSSDHWENFTRIELYLAAFAPIGFLFILGMNSITLPWWPPYQVELFIARIPAIIVGFLSGFELPYLMQMVEEEVGDANNILPESVASGVKSLHGVVFAVLSLGFHTTENDGERSGLSVVLAMDYLGGLAGAVIYAKFLYPEVGLIPTVFVLAFLNALAALIFVSRFSGTSWGVFAGDGDSRNIVSQESKAVIMALLVLTSGLGVTVANHEQVNSELTQMYLEHQFEQEYNPAGDTPSQMDITITDHDTTEYQNMVMYERTWTGDSDNPYFNGTTETCMRLDTAVQMCDSWADSYHQGLVDVPMSMYDNGTETDVLVIGGGDWVAIDHLRKYNVSVDHVDIDGEFMNYAKDEPFFAKYHNDSFEYEHLNTTVGDGYNYVKESDKKYDVILLDIPGAKDDSLLKLYSTEFYTHLSQSLEDDGVVVSWAYSRAGYPSHHKAYMNTVRDAGFTSHMPYWAVEDLDGDGELENVERFYVFSPNGQNEAPELTGNGSAYVARHADEYRDAQWRTVPHYDGIDVNSIFDPNYDILVG